MALTQYTADTDIIETLGTNPEDRPTLTDNTFKGKFDENAANIKAFLNAMIAELASTATGKGASQIGIEDSAGRYTATQIEAALAEIAGAGRTTETVKGLSDLISTNDGKLTTHKAEAVSITTSVARDISLTSTQTITLPFHAKNIFINAVIDGTLKASWGMCDGSMNQNVMAMYVTGIIGSGTHVVVLNDGVGNSANGAITAIGDTSITITWTKTGSPTGTAYIFINATTH